MSELFAVILIPFAAAFVIVGLPVYVVDRYQCASYQEATGKTTKYVGLECYVQDKGQWFAWSEYKNRLVATGSAQ